jgi:hypothetical protein
MSIVVVHSSTRVWKVCRFSQPWDAWFNIICNVFHLRITKLSMIGIIISDWLPFLNVVYPMALMNV